MENLANYYQQISLLIRYLNYEIKFKVETTGNLETGA